MKANHHYFLGIDAGGSKTSAVIVGADGVIKGQGEAEGANPHNMSYQQAWQHITQAVVQAKQMIPDVDEMLSGACLGLAGLDTAQDKTEIQNFLQGHSLYDQTFNARQLLVVNDAYIGLHSGTDSKRAINIIAGTGSHVFGINDQGKTASAGCWGYLLGDQGSGFALGQAVLRQVMAEYDGRLEQTLLTQATLEQLQLHSVEDISSWAYRGNVPIKEIASLSQLYRRSELETVLQSHLNQAVEALMIAFQAVVKRLGIESEVVLPVVLTGGLLEIDMFKQKLTEALSGLKQPVDFVFPTQPPVFGALALAQSYVQSSFIPDNAFVLQR